MRVQVVTRSAEPSEAVTWLATELREQGISVELSTEAALHRDAPADILIWEYPGGGIEPSIIEDAAEYAAAFASVIAPVPPQRVLLFNSPRNRDSLIVPSRLGLVGSVNKHDAWVAYTPGMLNKQPWYQSGIAGRGDLLTALGCTSEDEEGGYTKVPVNPFPSLPALLKAYLERYLAWLPAARP